MHGRTQFLAIQNTSGYKPVWLKHALRDCMISPTLVHAFTHDSDFLRMHDYSFIITNFNFVLLVTKMIINFYNLIFHPMHFWHQSTRKKIRKIKISYTNILLLSVSTLWYYNCHWAGLCYWVLKCAWQRLAFVCLLYTVFSTWSL